MTDLECLDRFKQRVLDVLKYSISFFDRHQLKWFIACGSAIGAVRHKGFIPWDDDIDVYMPREDYNKLKSLQPELLNDGYRFIDWDVDNYPLGFGKISDNNTTLWSEKRFKVNYGVYIDIFPLDLTYSGMMSFGIKWMKYRKLLFNYRAKISKITISDLFKGPKKNNNWRVVAAKIPLMFLKKKDILKQIKEMESIWNKAEGDRYVSYTEVGMYMFPRKWFEEYTLMPFEDINVRVSKYYHDYLTYMYGDYMTPPPIEQRTVESAHGKYYVNLDKNIPLNKIIRS